MAALIRRRKHAVGGSSSKLFLPSHPVLPDSPSAGAPSLLLPVRTNKRICIGSSKWSNSGDGWVRPESSELHQKIQPEQQTSGMSAHNGTPSSNRNNTVEASALKQAPNPKGKRSSRGTDTQLPTPKDISSGEHTSSLLSRDEDDTGLDTETAGGCLADWVSNKGIWDNPSPVRQMLWAKDPGLNQSLISSGTTISQIFNQDMWELHRKPDRHWVHIFTLGHSTVLRRIFKPCLVLSMVAAVVCTINTLMPSNMPKLAISLVPHTLLGAALSLLLVFRTNSSYARFVDGRSLWGSLVRFSRDWSRIAATYYPKELKSKAARYIQVLAVVLKAHLRSGRTRQNPSDPTTFRDDPTQVVNELLPCSEATLVLQQTNRPFFVLCRMTQIAREAGDHVPGHVSHTVEHILSELLSVVGGCERILGTPIPLSYTRHTSRSLVLWLATLPLGMWPVTGWLSIPAMFVISFIFFGIEEIGVEIEEPFCILPLHPLCRAIASDVQMAMSMAPAC